MAVDFDKIDSRITETDNGFRIERTAIVTGVTGNADTRLINAMNDAQMPSIGDAHPQDSTIDLREKSGRVIDPETVAVTLVYYREDGSETGSSNATSRASATTSIEETKFDSSGNPLVTQYVHSAGSVQVDRENFTAEVERPRVTFDFEYKSATFPQTDINTYLGKINSVIWNGYAVETILCTAVNVDQTGDDYRVRFSFAYNPDTWAFKARTQYTPSGAHPTNPDSDLNLTTGERPFDVYSTVDFTPLGFTL